MLKQRSLTVPEIDVKVFGNFVSIKTCTGKKVSSVKLIWTVDAEKAQKFYREYIPHCDMLLAQVNWDNLGGLYLFPRSAQFDVLSKIGRQKYIRLPKPGTNPRGVEISSESLGMLITHPESRNIQVMWKKVNINYDPYAKWLELWGRD